MYEKELLEKDSILKNFNCSLEDLKNFSPGSLIPKNLVPDNLPEWAASKFKKQLKLLDKKYNILPIQSPISNTLIFQLSSHDGGELSYITYAYYDFNSNLDYEEKNISDLIFFNAYLIRSLNNINHCNKNWIEIYINGKEFILNHTNLPVLLEIEEEKELDKAVIQKYASQLKSNLKSLGLL